MSTDTETVATATESAAPAQVETYTDGRDSSNRATNGHDDSSPMSLSEYRQGLRDKREDAERSAAAKARVDAMTDEEKLALSRRTVNPLYAQHDLAQSLDPAEIERLGLQEAKAPPDADQEYEELKSKLDDLAPQDKASALSHLAQLQRSRTEAKRAEIEATTRNMQHLHQQELAAYNAQYSHLNVVDATMQANFQQMYGVPMNAEGLQYLAQTQPEFVAQAALEMVTANHQRQQAEAVLAQHEQEAHANDLMLASIEDKQFNEKMRASDPDIFDGDRLKPEIGKGVLSYVASMGIDRDSFKSLLTANAKVPMRDHRFQQIVIDAARFRMAQAKAKDAKRAPLPKVQRPGEPTGSRSTHLDDRIAALESKGDRSGLSLREASKLNAMKIRRERG
jgi:hypothetical protein